MSRAEIAKPSTYARAYRAGDVSADAPGTPIPFVLSTPGKKRDGADLGVLPFLVSNYVRNPVVTAWHNYADWPVGRGEILVEGGNRNQTLRALAAFDLEDPVGAIADRKYRQGWMHAVSLGWETVDAGGVPSRISKAAPVGHDVLEFAIVTVPGDPDALAEISPAERMGVRSFLREARDAAPDAVRRSAMAEALRQWELCDGEACARMAGGVIVGEPAKRVLAKAGRRTSRPASSSKRHVVGVNVVETVATWDEESYAMGAAHLTPEQKARITEAVLASIQEDGDELTHISVSNWQAWWGDEVGAQRATVTLTVALPPDLVEELSIAAVSKAAAVVGDAESVEPAEEAEAFDEAGAETRWLATARAMHAALWTDRADDADDRARRTAYTALLPEYRRLGKTPPRFLPAAIVAALPDARRRALFVEGECDMAQPQTGTRAGKKIAKRNLDRLSQARDLIDEVLADASPSEDDDEAEGKRAAARSCGCGGGQSAEPPAALTEALSELSTRFPGYQFGLVTDDADPEPTASEPEATTDADGERGAEDQPAEGDTPDPDTSRRSARASSLDRLANLFNGG